MRTASLILVVLGGILSLGPLAWLWLAGSRRVAELHAELAVIEATPRGEKPPLPADRWTNWGDLLRLKQDIELAIIDNATTAARLPLTLVALGVVASTVGGVLSMYA